MTQLISEATRITSVSRTLIDVIYTNTPHRVVDSGVVHVGISDHSLIYAIRKIAIPVKANHRVATSRSFKNFNKKNFLRDLKALPWKSIADIDSLDCMWELWKDMFLSVANCHAPLKTKRVRNKTSPWIGTRPQIQNAYELSGRTGPKHIHQKPPSPGHAALTQATSFANITRVHSNRNLITQIDNCTSYFPQIQSPTMSCLLILQGDTSVPCPTKGYAHSHTAYHKPLQPQNSLLLVSTKHTPHQRRYNYPCFHTFYLCCNAPALRRETNVLHERPLRPIPR